MQHAARGNLCARARDGIVTRFAALPLVVPSRNDHVAAADLRTARRRRRLQVETIDALLAQLCIRHDLTMLTTDADFERIASRYALRVWAAS